MFKTGPHINNVIDFVSKSREKAFCVLEIYFMNFSLQANIGNFFMLFFPLVEAFRKFIKAIFILESIPESFDVSNKKKLCHVFTFTNTSVK